MPGASTCELLLRPPTIESDIARRAFDRVAAIHRAPTLERLTREMEQGLAEIGFKHFVLTRIRRGEMDVLAGRRHPVWWPHMMANHYLRDDVAWTVLCKGLPPSFYTDVESAPDATVRLRAIAEDRRALGIREGFAMANRMPNGDGYVVSMIGPGADRADPDVRAAALILASFFFAAGVRLIAPPRDLADAPPLTPRQLECLRWVRDGKSSTDIGDILSLSANTVNEHVAQACTRLGVRTRIQAVTRAIDLGLIDP